MKMMEIKFMLMSRIALHLQRKGLSESVTIDGKVHFAHLVVQLDCEVIEWVYAGDTTEQDLMKWLEVLENE